MEPGNGPNWTKKSLSVGFLKIAERPKQNFARVQDPMNSRTKGSISEATRPKTYHKGDPSLKLDCSYIGSDVIREFLAKSDGKENGADVKPDSESPGNELRSECRNNIKSPTSCEESQVPNRINDNGDSEESVPLARDNSSVSIESIDVPKYGTQNSILKKKDVTNDCSRLTRLDILQKINRVKSETAISSCINLGVKLGVHHNHYDKWARVKVPQSRQNIGDLYGVKRCPTDVAFRTRHVTRHASLLDPGILRNYYQTPRKIESSRNNKNQQQTPNKEMRPNTVCSTYQQKSPELDENIKDEKGGTESKIKGLPENQYPKQGSPTHGHNRKISGPLTEKLAKNSNNVIKDDLQLCGIRKKICERSSSLGAFGLTDLPGFTSYAAFLNENGDPASEVVTPDTLQNISGHDDTDEKEVNVQISETMANNISHIQKLANTENSIEHYIDLHPENSNNDLASKVKKMKQMKPNIRCWIRNPKSFKVKDTIVLAKKSPTLSVNSTALLDFRIRRIEEHMLKLKHRNVIGTTSYHDSARCGTDTNLCHKRSRVCDGKERQDDEQKSKKNDRIENNGLTPPCSHRNSKQAVKLRQIQLDFKQRPLSVKNKYGFYLDSLTSE